MTEEEREIFWKLVNSTTKTNTYEEEIMNIILEDARAYFEAHRAAKDTAQASEERVTLYVSDQQ